MTTYIRYTYTDGNNYKQDACIRLTGPLTDEQADMIVAACDEGEFFIPQQVWLPSLVMRFGGIDPDADHPWHSMVGWDGRIDMDTVPVGDVVATFTPDGLTAAFTAAAAKGWDEITYSPAAGAGR